MTIPLVSSCSHSYCSSYGIVTITVHDTVHDTVNYVVMIIYVPFPEEEGKSSFLGRFSGFYRNFRVRFEEK